MREVFVAAVAAAVLAGTALAAQPGVNGELARRMKYPLHASLVSFVIGTAALVLICLVWTGSLPKPRDLAGTPAWVLSGGLLGAIVVTASLLIGPRVGATTWLALLVAVQLAASVVLDHYGLAGYRVHPVSLMRVVGVVLLVAGVVLVCRS
ncbi:MAG TPA: DMT family transporter [Planctomycetaceae bacterium]